MPAAIALGCRETSSVIGEEREREERRGPPEMIPVTYTFQLAAVTGYRLAKVQRAAVPK